jgi:hypothetical protein
MEEMDLLDKVLAQKQALLLKLQQQNNQASNPVEPNATCSTTASSSTSPSPLPLFTAVESVVACANCEEGKCFYHSDVALVFRKAKGGDVRERKSSQTRIKSNPSASEKPMKKTTSVESKRSLLEDGWEVLVTTGNDDQEKLEIAVEGQVATVNPTLDLNLTDPS